VEVKMTEAALMAAVPGQSLTDYPKNYPWERPPEITDPNDAIKFHIDRIADEDVIDNVLDLLEFGIPAKTLSESMMTAAVGSGIHSIDVSLIVEPIVRDFMMKAADMAGVNYKETFKPDEMTMAERASLFNDAVASTPEGERDKGFEIVKEAAESMKEEPVEEPTEEEPKGLMAR
jgi:hypothetical protein